MNLLDDAGFAFFNGIGIFWKFKGNFNTSSFKILAGDVLVLPEFTFRFIFFYWAPIVHIHAYKYISSLNEVGPPGYPKWASGQLHDSFWSGVL